MACVSNAGEPVRIAVSGSFIALVIATRHVELSTGSLRWASESPPRRRE